LKDGDQWMDSTQPEEWGDSLPLDCSDVTLVHLAWIARGDYLTDPINENWLHYSKILFDSFKEKGGGRFLSLGTSLETDPFQKAFGETRYVKSKKEFRDYVFSSSNVLSSWIIPHTLFGKFEDSKRLVPTVINTLVGNGQILLKNPTESRDFTPVNRLVKLITDLVESESEGIFECKTGTINTVQTFVHQLSNLYTSGEVGKSVEGIQIDLLESIDYWKSKRNLS
jgi:dTDP-6-deoxy-L-talose 4-dehydrogenase (NAD+)